jgi:hypothetical protein
MAGRLLVGAPLKVAQNQWCAIAIGEPFNLLVEYAAYLVSG